MSPCLGCCVVLFAFWECKVHHRCSVDSVGGRLKCRQGPLRGVLGGVQPVPGRQKLHLAAAAWPLATVPNATRRGQPLSGLTIKQ